jgi:predicted deacylase
MDDTAKKSWEKNNLRITVEGILRFLKEAGVKPIIEKLYGR